VVLNRRHLPLIGYMAYADLRAEAARTYAGFLWWVLEPVLSLIVYFVVFEIVLDRGTEHFVAFLFVGLVPWRWLATTLAHGSNSILGARALMEQVHVPKIVFVIVAFLTDAAKFCAVFLVLLVFVWLNGFGISWWYLLLPFVILVQGVLILAFEFLFAAVTPLIPDIRMVLENVIRLWLFLSGVFYDVNQLSEKKEFVFRLNPMTNVIEAYRDILLHGQCPKVALLGAILVGSLILLAIGVHLVTRFDYLYPKLAR
jgi:lipopolysaccharide transport system permease protein